MSVDFSWHLEEDTASLPEGEPQKEMHPRRGWLRRVLMILVILVAAAGVLGYGYYYRQQQRLIAEFQRVLDQEVTFWRSGRYDSPQLRLVVDVERWRDSKSNYAILGFFGVTLFPDPRSLPLLTVKKVELHDDMAWVWVEWEDDGARYRRVHFYRRVDGLWKRTPPDKRFAGRKETLEGTTFHWTFYERDAPYVRPLAEWAEQISQQVAADFGLSEPPRLRVRFVYQVEDSVSRNSRAAQEVVYPAPLITRVRVDGKPDRLLRTMVAWGYVNHVLETVAPSMPPSLASPYPSAYYRFRSGVLQWETARVATPVWKETPYFPTINVDRPLSLDDLFRFPPRRPDGDPFAYVISLVFFIGDRYGPTKVIAVLQQLKETPRIERALANVLGPDFDVQTFEEEWHAYLRAHADMFNKEQ